MKLTLARPGHAELISSFYTRVHDDKSFPHQELFTASTVARLIQDGEMAIVLATEANAIVGCGLGFLLSWNQSLEIGALSVPPGPNKAAVAKALFEGLRRMGSKNYGVVFFRAPGERPFRRGRKMGARCWGFRPSPGSESLSDAELVMGFANPLATNPRAQPPNNAITSTKFAARILRHLEGAEGGVPFPKSFPVGCPRGTGAPVISGRVWPTYHSRGNYITIENAAGTFPTEIIKEFAHRVEEKGVHDIRLALPVNQEEAYFELLEYGFRAVAYLPGWYLRGAYRFDCVQLVRGMPKAPQKPETFIERAVARIDAELNQ